METREEKQARWADPSTDRLGCLRVLKGSIPLNPSGIDQMRITDEEIKLEQIEDYILSPNENDNPDLWHVKAISLPRLRPGRLVLSIPKSVFQRVQDSWSLHPRTVEVFLSNNGVFTTFYCPTTKRTSLLLKVANSRSTGFDCASVTFDPCLRTTFVLYHHLQDEAAVFATLLTTPELLIEPCFFVAAVYRAHCQHLETHRNTIDDAIQGIERQTGFGNPGRLLRRRNSLDEYPLTTDPKSIIQQLSYCQTDLAIIGHVARCCLDSGAWLVQVLDEALSSEKTLSHEQDKYDGSELHHLAQKHLKSLKATRLKVRQGVEYMRRRTAMLLSQVQQMKDRAQSQTNFMLNTITQSDAEYTAAIAVDGKRDSIAMKTIAILGIAFLPGTFVATLFSINMFEFGDPSSGGTSSLTVSPSIWIYWAITVPLTVATCLVWVVWSKKENRETNKRLMLHRTRAFIESKIDVTKKASYPTPSEMMV